MRVLLDTHMLGQKETGNERYWKNLSEALIQYKKNNNSFIKYTSKSNNGLYRIFLGFNKSIKSIKPNIIHVQNFAPFIKTVSIVNTIHDVCFRYYSDLYCLKTKFAFQYFFKRSLDLSDAIICVSEYTKRSLLKFYQVNSKKVFVVYEAADDSFRYVRNKTRLRKILLDKFNLKNKYFLVVGNVENRKLPYQIIEAFNNILKKFPEVKLVFAGLNKINIKTTKNIKMLGYVSDGDLNMLYNGSVALISLSLCEGFGLPAVEAISCKTPVICSDIGVFREILKNGALFVKDKYTLIQAMNLLLTNQSLRKRLSILGYKRSGFFSWEKAAKQTLAVYHSIIKKPYWKKLAV